MEISDLKRLLSAGYRVFFLLAGAFATLAILIWDVWQASNGGFDLPVAQAPHLWHAHEMIFGYGSAAVAGFLLTAAPSWSKSGPEPWTFFAASAGLWLAGRVVMFWSEALPVGLVAVIDLLFLPILAGRILQTLLKRPKPQQLILLVAIMIFWSGNLLVHLEWIGVTQDTASQGLRGGLLALCGLIMILGGRVTPAFTTNAMRRKGHDSRLPKNPPLLAALAIVPALAVPVGLLAGAPTWMIGVAGLGAGIAGLARVALWRSGWTLDQPILWVLHLSYAVNAVGFILLGLSGFDVISDVAALHVLGIGGVGGMTLAVMSRAALGHSGRALVAPKLVVVGYILVPLAALIRLVASLAPQVYANGVMASGALWAVAFGLFTISLWPVFWGERVPKAPAAPPPTVQT